MEEIAREAQGAVSLVPFVALFFAAQAVAVCTTGTVVCVLARSVAVDACAHREVATSETVLAYRAVVRAEAALVL
jgi:hypothetical protein